MMNSFPFGKALKVKTNSCSLQSSDRLPVKQANISRPVIVLGITLRGSKGNFEATCFS